MTAREKLHKLGKPQGECYMCGAPYARHRLWDSVDGGIRSSDGFEATVKWYAVSRREARLAKAAYADARRRHVALPGRTE